MIIIKGLLYICGVFSFCAILFRLGIIPPIFGYADNYQQINEVIMNISYSYLAGLIFYLLNECLPSYYRENKAMSMIAPKLQTLYSKMDWIIAVTKMEANIDKENHTITLDDCSIANTVNLKVARIAVFAYVRINKVSWCENPTKELYDTIYTQAKYARKIKEISESIQYSSVANYLSNDILTLLFQIQNSDYLKDLEINEQIAETTNLSNLIEIHGGKQKLYNFIQLYLKLRKYSFDKHEHKLVKMNDKEKKEYDDFLVKMKPYIDVNINKKGRFKIYKGHQQII